MTGKVIDTYYYDAFGNIMEEEGDTNNPYRYAGYQYDAETGLYYLNARMYDPKIARFLQEDTYSGDPNDVLSLNLYTYCQNDPLTYDDPSGHFRIAIGAGLGFLIGAGASMISDAVSGEFSLKKNWKKYLGAGVQGGVIGATAGATMGASLLTMGATGLGAGAVGNTANQVIRNSGFNNFSAKELAVSSVATGVALPAGKAASGLASKAAEKFVSQVLQKTAQGGIIGGTAGSAGGFAGNVTDQTWDIASGTKDTFDTGSLIRDTGLGAITGFGIGTGIGYLGTKLPTNKTNVNKPTNQVTKPVQGNLNEEIGLINSPANRVGNNALKLLPAPKERLMLPMRAGGIKGGSKTPSEIAQSWQGTGKYPGVDTYKDITIKQDKIIYRGEPNGTEYFTTRSAIERSGYDANTVFEGLQVEKNPIHGYRSSMQGYKATVDLDAAFGITKANPQFGKGGLPQIFMPNANDLINNGYLVPVDKILLKK